MAELTQQLEAHRVPLTAYCYRMLGSVVDADDATQDTLVRAWRGMNTFDERSSLRTWLYKIATNVCLDALSARSRRERPIDIAAAGTTEDDLATRPREHWLEPIPDALAVPADADPAQQLFLKESIRLAFVAAVQYLAPKQRAVLLLTDVLGCSAADVAARSWARYGVVDSVQVEGLGRGEVRDADACVGGEVSTQGASMTAAPSRLGSGIGRGLTVVVAGVLLMDAGMKLAQMPVSVRSGSARSVSNGSVASMHSIRSSRRSNPNAKKESPDDDEDQDHDRSHDLHDHLPAIIVRSPRRGV